MQLSEAKRRISIPELWIRLGLPGSAKKNCRCPWRRDLHPSFSVFADGSKWKDHGTAESGDVVDFFQQVTGLPQGEACREFIRLAKGYTEANRITQRRPPSVVIRSLPRLLPGTQQERRTLASTRSISCEAVDIAVQRGLLYFGDYRALHAWFVTDSSRRVIQARRMDNQNWWRAGPKAMTLPGGQASWPVGASHVTPFDSVILAEGGPDFLAAFHFLALVEDVSNVTAIAMLGAGNNIHPDALHLFRGKLTRIVPHLDEPDKKGRRAGIDAAERWRRQLNYCGANPTIINLREVPCVSDTIKDLNDATQLPREAQWEIAKRLVDR